MIAGNWRKNVALSARCGIAQDTLKAAQRWRERFLMRASAVKASAAADGAMLSIAVLDAGSCHAATAH